MRPKRKTSKISVFREKETCSESGILTFSEYLFCPHMTRRSKLYIACSDFFQKSERAHAAAPPSQIEPASLGFDLVLGANLKVMVAIVLRCYKENAATFVAAFVLGFGPTERASTPFYHLTAEVNSAYGNSGPGHPLLPLRGNSPRPLRFESTRHLAQPPKGGIIVLRYYIKNP